MYSREQIATGLTADQFINNFQFGDVLFLGLKRNTKAMIY